MTQLRTVVCTLFLVLIFAKTGVAKPLLTILYTANTWGYHSPLRA